MAKPIVAVIGRPNVGKSTFFNRLVGERVSIVEDTPGVTRDRIFADVEWLTHKFTLIDTGGIEPDSNDKILSQMRRQAELAIEMADVVIFIVDSKQGLQDADYKVADMLRKARKKVVLVVNKVDEMKNAPIETAEFYNLGIGEPHAISAQRPAGLGDVLDVVVDNFKDFGEIEDDEDVIKVAVIGKPNAGKSSLINKIMGEDRVIVSDIAGTTRDAIDTKAEINGQKFLFIDTAGIRRKSKIKENIERYSVIRAVAAVERAEVVIIVVDAEEGITEQDTKIAGIAHESGKAVIVAVNKWDLIEKDGKTMNKYEKDVTEDLAYMKYSKKIFISAHTGQRVNKLYDLIVKISENHSRRVSTGLMNEVLYEAMAMNQTPSDKGKRLKIYYMTQVSIKPPTFVLFVNDKSLMHFSYLRYIENKMRDSFDFDGTPLKFIVREKTKKDELKR
ncbi:MAG: ribosome biogenesis GTPase Der [Clostridia bacterium]|jgi:GTP-binding protein|nr:ribosome biogenesis GTPase Der [Clostridia bacterium]